MKPFFVSIPHSGEKVPPETPWLHGLPEPVLMRDVDRYVNRLYRPALEALQIPWVETEWHRYVVDLNRLPEDVDQDSVRGSTNLSGKFARGFHWVITTLGERLMPAPMTLELHKQLVERYFEPFHAQVRAQYESFKQAGVHEIFHLDAHSMPSMGTKEHRDPGQKRADIVVSDCSQKSCKPWFKDLVIESYRQAGFQVAYNWPYLGGRVTETYGHPSLGQHAIQVEMSRALYMNEEDKSYTSQLATGVQERLKYALKLIHSEVPDIAR